MNKLIIVDNEVTIRGSLEIALGFEYEIKTVSSAEKCLLSMQSFKPDLIITDYQLTGMNGLKLIQIVHHMNSTLPVIMISAYPHQRLKDKAIRLGCKGFILKPFKLDALKNIIDDVLCSSTLTYSI